MKDYPSSLDALDRIDAMELAESQKLFSLFERGRLVADGPRDKVIAMLRGGPTKVPDSAMAEAKGVKTVA